MYFLRTLKIFLIKKETSESLSRSNERYLLFLTLTTILSFILIFIIRILFIGKMRLEIVSKLREHAPEVKMPVKVFNNNLTVVRLD